MTAEGFLDHAENARRQIEALQNFKAALQEELESMSWLASSCPVYSTKSRPIYEAIRMAKGKQSAMSAEIESCRRELQEVEAVIDAVPDPGLRDMLRMHYMDGLPWEEIADKQHYSSRHIFVLRRKALALVEIPERYKQEEDADDGDQAGTIRSQNDQKAG